MRPISHTPHMVVGAAAATAFAASLFAASPAAAQSTVEPDDFVPRQVAVLGALDKITARERELTIPVGTSDRFYGLVVMVRTCQQTTVSTTPQNAAFLQITDESSYGQAGAAKASAQGEGEGEEAPADAETPPHLFSGWMFSASPSLSGMEHPVYDIVLKGCHAQAPQTASAPLPHRKHGVRSAAVPLPDAKPLPGDPPVTQTAQVPEETG